MRNIQGPSHTTGKMYQVLQEFIFDETGVQCSVLVTPHFVSIRTKDYSDYVLAKKAIKEKTDREIIRYK